MPSQVGKGTGACLASATNVLCAALVCEDGKLTFGILGSGHSRAVAPFDGTVAVDGDKPATKPMTSRIVAKDLLHLRTPIGTGDRLFARLKAGNRVRIGTSKSGEPYEFSLSGSSAEFKRVAAACR